MRKKAVKGNNCMCMVVLCLRRLMRFKGGWESLLTTTLGVSVSLHVSPWATPTTIFSGDSLACVSVGASALTPIELILKNLAQDDSVAGFFTHTDLFPSPPDAFFETVNHLVFGSCKFRLVVAGSSPIWSTWLDHWANSGRAMTCNYEVKAQSVSQVKTR